MKNLLFLVHRIPFPPNKGDKIRSYHFLKGLIENYHIHLAAFVDDPEDKVYIEKVEQMVRSSLFVDLNPSVAKIKSLAGLINNKALTLPYYYDRQMQEWVDKTIADNKITKIFIFSSAMAQYVLKYKELEIIIDFVDVDSDKWLQYSQKAKWPMNWVYQRESKKLLQFDSMVASYAKMNVFVSEEESLLFKKLIDKETKQISFVNNGVDTEYFNTEQHHENPYPIKDNIIVFTGAMDYWANVDAVIWFAKEVFPLIKEQCSEAQFYIVGSKPSNEVESLANIEDVFVTGRVEDIRCYLHYAHVVVAPLLIARGIQNKVLEAMAMGKAIVATPQAIEGIRLTGQAVCIEQKTEQFSEQVLSYLNKSVDPCYEQENRVFVEKNFGWDASLKRLIEMIDYE